MDWQWFEWQPAGYRRKAKTALKKIIILDKSGGWEIASDS
jgi:hypothetical protein